MKTVAVIQARIGSTRLPGKVLRPLCDKTVLAHVLDRVRAATRLDEVWVATTDSPGDTPITAESIRLGAHCFRGSEHDVLSRYFGAAQAADAQAVVRITADCPLFDGELLDRMLAEFNEANRAGPGVEYLSNVLRRTYPRGLDAEIFTMAALARAHREAVQPHEREHVTPYFYQHPDLFRLRSFEGEVDLSGCRWTLDTPEDWRFMEAVYGALYRPGRLFTTADVLKLLKEHPELGIINAHVEQKKLAK